MISMADCHAARSAAILAAYSASLASAARNCVSMRRGTQYPRSSCRALMSLKSGRMGCTSPRMYSRFICGMRLMRISVLIPQHEIAVAVVVGLAAVRPASAIDAIEAPAVLRVARLAARYAGPAARGVAVSADGLSDRAQADWLARLGGLARPHDGLDSLC